MSQTTQLLQAEIEFWREMLSSRDATASAAGTERMQMALALAERKLLALSESQSGADRGSVDCAGSPYFPARLD